jgi:hydroxypyruvate isomerase
MQSVSRRGFLCSTTALAGAATGAAGLAAPDLDPKTVGKTPHTKFAVNVEMWFRKIPFMDRFKAAAELGFPAVEIWPVAGRDVDAMASVTQDLGLALAQFTAWGFKPGLNDPVNHDDFVKAVADGCRAAHKLKCKLMTVVAGDDIAGMTQEQMHKNVIAGLRRARKIAEDNDVTLILEPMNIRVDHKGHCLYGSAPAMRICDEVDSSHVKINWDLYHMHITEGDLCGHMREGWKAGHIGYLQLADHPGRNEPGTGEIHYNRVLREAYELGYRGYVGLELSPKTTDLAAAIACAKADVW